MDPGNVTNSSGLPSRLFDPDERPVGRVNVYSRPDLLSFVYDQLRDTDEWEEIKSSCFGHLFNLPVTRCYISCKLIHSLLSRQLVTRKRYELWTVFGNEPLRFSLSEFESLTCLNCLPFPDGYVHDSNPDPVMGIGSAWDTYFGKNKDARILDLMALLKKRKGVSGWPRVGLALLLIIDGVLIANHQGDKRLTPKYVNMLCNREEFMNFPWGRESFLRTISCMVPSRLSSGRSENGVEVLRKQLKQVSLSLKGFPLALQLLAFNRIPELEKRIPNYTDRRTILEVGFSAHAKNAGVTMNSFRDVEDNHEVSGEHPDYELIRQTRGEVWVDEVEDVCVVLLEKLLSRGHLFGMKDWGGVETHLAERKRRGRTKCSGISNYKRRKVMNTSSRGRSYSTRSRDAGMDIKIEEAFENDMISLEDVGEEDARTVNDKPPDTFPGDTMQSVSQTDFFVTSAKRRNESTTPGPRVNSSGVGVGDDCGQDIKAWVESRIESLNAAWVKRFEIFSRRFKLSGKFGRLRGGHVFRKISKRGMYGFKKRKTSVNEGFRLSTSKSETCELVNEPSRIVHGSVEIQVLSDEVGSSSNLRDGRRSKFPTGKNSPAGTFEAGLSLSGELGCPYMAEHQGEVGWDNEFVFPGLIQVCSSAVLYCDEAGVLHSFLHVWERTADEDAGMMDFDGSFHNRCYQFKVHVPVTDIVLYRPPMLCYNYTPVPQVCNVAVLYCDHDGLLHSFNAEDVDMLANLIHELNIIDYSSVEFGCRSHSEQATVTAISEAADHMVASGISTVRLGKEIENVSQIDKPWHKPDNSCLLNSYICGNPYPVFQPLDMGRFNALEKLWTSNPSVRHITKCNFAFDNSFLLELAKPTGWVNTLHMQILLDMLGKHHAEALAWSRSVFLTPLLANYILSDERQFELAEDKRLFEWSGRIYRIVAKPGAEWLEDVDLIYMPYIWGNKHWVGLVINLREAYIEVLDPYVDLTKEAKVQKHLSFFARALPYIIKQCCIMKHASSIVEQPFKFARVPGLYQNTRGGDCGPVAVKFLEMAAYRDLGRSILEITDGVVNDLRKQYAMDIYGHYVVPMHNCLM